MASGNTYQKGSSSRFADIGVLPKRLLAPIEGYEKFPLVSLEEAVKPLVNIVPKVERNAKIVKQNCQEPKDGLTPDESAAIMLYTYESMPHEDSLYVKLNATLRSEQRKNLIPWFSYLRLILTALAQLPSKRRFVNRGVKENLCAEYSKNKIFIWWGFSSCTSSVDVLENDQFFGTSGDRTLFQIECDTAKNIKKHSFIPGEDEILLLPARQFQVKACLDSGNGLHIIQLKELKPDFDLIEPVPVSNLSIKPKESSIASQYEYVSTKLQASSLEGIPNLPANARWKQNGVTVAGGNGRGYAINQLNLPKGLFVDDDQRVVIADYGNHRIVQWKKNDTNGEVIAGGNGQGNRLDQLNFPTDVLVDNETNSLIIADRENRRVVRWSRRNGTRQGEIIIDNVSCYGLAMDDQRYLYVSDVENHEVRRYRLGDKNGTLVAGGNGQGKSLNQFYWPAYLFVDRQQNVYVSDNENNRVMKWKKCEKEGIVVAGESGHRNALTQLYHNNGIFVDTLDTLYVVDSENNRVMRWPQGDKQGTVIVGGNGLGGSANQFGNPWGLFFDRHGNLYVTDLNNCRVQRFDIIK